MLRLDMNLLWTALNLVIWYILIRKFLFKPINAVISKREEAIASQYTKAQELQEEAAAEKNRSHVCFRKNFRRRLRKKKQQP